MPTANITIPDYVKGMRQVKAGSENRFSPVCRILIPRGKGHEAGTITHFVILRLLASSQTDIQRPPDEAVSEFILTISGGRRQTFPMVGTGEDQ